MKIRYLLNGFECNPVKRDEIFLEINHDQGSIINQDRPNVGVNNLYFAREDVALVMAQMNSAPGITEGIPFDIEIKEHGTTKTINFYINGMDGFKRSKDGISASVKLLQSMDWLNDRVQSFSFESLYNEGVGGSLGGSVPFTPIIVDGISYPSYQNYLDKRCIYIPYVISTIPNFQTAFMASFSLIYIGNSLYGAINNILKWAIPTIGLGSSVGVVQIVLEIAQTVILIASLIVLIIELVNSLIQPLKYHAAMLVVDMLKLIAAKTGLTLQSSIWETYPYNQIAYLPSKFNPIQEPAHSTSNTFGGSSGGALQKFRATGFQSPAYASGAHDSSFSNIQKGYYDGCGGDFLRLVKTFCNGKIMVPDGTNNMVIERRDYYPSSPTFQLPNIRQDWNGYNTDEMTATITLNFAVDLNDKNSIDFIPQFGKPFYQGTRLQATHQQNVTHDILKVCLTGLKEVNIQAARGAGKDKLNFIEDVVASLQILWDDIVAACDAVVNAAIDGMNVVIDIINVFIDVWNALIDAVNSVINAINNVLGAIVSVINDIADAVNSLGGSVGHANNTHINPIGGHQNHILHIAHISIQQPFPSPFTHRIGALLLENDMVTTPKLLLVALNRADFTNTIMAGNLGQDRIAYLHPNNQYTVNTGRLWNDFYFIDAFCNSTDAFGSGSALHGTFSNNKFTKIAPASNHLEDSNPTTMRLADFLNMVNNPQFKDNWGENVYAETVQWFIEKNGKALLQFRKQGWLQDPNNKNGVIRASEIYDNLNLAITLPTGQ